MFFEIIYTFTFLAVCESMIVMPQNPCPDIFRYENSPRNEIYGIMTFRNDYSGSYRVELNMSLPAFTNQNLGITRLSPSTDVQTGGDLIYQVTFPNSIRIPQIISVVFNQRLYCSSMQLPGEGTFLTAFDFFSIPIIVQMQLTTPKPTTTSPYPTTPQEITVPTTSSPYPMIPHELIVPTTRDYKRPSFLYFTLPHTSLDHTATSQPMQHTTSQLPTIRTTTQTTTQTTTRSTTRTTTQPTTIIEIRQSEELECGIGEDTQALVVHGTVTTEGQYPWLIAMFHLQESGEYKFKCAGNLISNRHVMTAAHCVRKDKFETVPKEDIILVLGKHNIKSWAVRSEIRDVKEMFIHPDYRKPSDADISILIMYKPVEFTDKIKPVCLWTETTETIVGSKGTVVGWGRDEFFSEYVTEPKEIVMPVVSQEDCLRSDERFIRLTSNRTFCAGTRKGGVCTGDSGGGFIMKRNGRWTLRGIVSSALVDSNTRSCDVHNYMVFSDVVKYKSWIDHVMTR